MTNAGAHQRLLKAADAAVVVPFRDVRFKNGSIPMQHQCHNNVRKWLHEHPEDQEVIGWLVSGYILDRHSVLQGRDGQPFDITPLQHSLPFFAHPGTAHEFWSLPAQVNLVC
jgi:hypothetical protein